MVQHEGEWHAVLSQREWRAMESAALLAADGRHGEAEATRYAARYHGRNDDRTEPPIVV